MDFRGQMSEVLPIMFVLFFIFIPGIIIGGRLLSEQAVYDECVSDCSRIGLDYFNHDYSSGLFSSSNKSCSCVNFDSNDVKIIWGN